MTSLNRAEAENGPQGNRAQRAIVTPEGVRLTVHLAERAERATAAIIDLLVIFGVIIVLGIAVLVALGSEIYSSWAISVFFVVSFALRSFYFIFFEFRWSGSTPGKRLIGIRVIDRAGGPLRSDAVFARNLMREIEMFIPISVLLGGAAGEGAEAWFNLFVTAWLGVFVLLPFFNRDRLRAGDIVAGTMVITAPREVLLPDLVQARRTHGSVPATAAARPEDAPAPALQFTQAQLAIYGIYELQTLENVLRDRGPNAAATRAAVAERIRRKIDWAPPPGAPLDPAVFLEAFYAALRAHLEARMLFGERRERKESPPEG